MRRFLYLILFVLPFASCSREEPADSGHRSAEREVYLSFADKTGTRSALNSAYVDYRKVKNVYLYVFDADSTCILVKDIGWTGDISQTYRLDPMPASGEYIFLAVGVDDNAGAVYGFPGAIAPGDRLENCAARLIPSQRAAMSAADLYVGVAAATVAAIGTSEVEIELKRKVSGILAYLRNIPYKVNSVQVKDLKIRLHANRHTEIPLIRDEANPYGSGTLDNSTYLFEYLLDTIPYDDAGNFYKPSARHAANGGVATVANTILMGAFMLPLEASASDAPTLSIELWGEDTGTSTYKLLRTYEAVYTTESGTATTVYPIEENHLYSIGYKTSDDTTGDDKPVDLSGSSVDVFVAPWGSYDVSADFPTVAQPAYLRPSFNTANYIFDSIGTSEILSIDDTYPAGGTWTLSVPADVDWIHIVDRSGTTPDYVKTLSGTGSADVELYINDYAKKNLLYDPNTLVFNYADVLKTLREDYRTALLTLNTTGFTGNAVTIPIRQYNTITIYFTNGSTGTTYDITFGINRLDYGCTFDRQTGAMIRGADSQIVWGFYTSDNFYIYDSNGEKDYYDGEGNCRLVLDKYAKGSSSYAEKFNGSIFDKAVAQAHVYADGPESNKASARLWYVPAYHQIYSIQGLCAKINREQSSNTDASFATVCSALNFVSGSDSWQWTSNGAPGTAGIKNKSYAVRLVRVFNANGSSDEYDYLVKKTRDQLYYVRRCRNFDQ